ncbi:MAG: acyl--CoA ligase, partial [Rhodovulum sp.]|nr:acyl--CoA ligase [Rhodovulum sp.]
MNAPETLSIADIHAQLTAPGQMLEMEEKIIRGIPTRVWKHAPPSLGAVLAFSRAYGEADFMVYEDERWSFERHFRASAHLANVLRERYGVKIGDRVAIAMRNFPEWSVAFWAAAAAGAIVVPLNAWWTGPELVYGLSDSGSTLLLCDGARLDRLAPELAHLPGLRIIVARDTRETLAGGAEHFDAVLGDIPAGAELPALTIDPEDDATIFYTSGTTGQPKGVLGTHRNICGNLLSLRFSTMRAALRGTVPGAPPAPAAAQAGIQGVYLMSVPFFHATGCHSILVANLAAGNKLVIMRKWDAGRALELIERERVSIFGGVPAMVWQVLT